ncbi:MAG: hypothetical protein JNK55_14825 [Rubrivivax sp.]|nr:hypothetical protein [Rubrivivax sp.]
MPKTRSPLFIALAATAGVLLLAAALVAWRLLFPSDKAARLTAMHGAPWQIETPAPGLTRVMGLSLPGSTLAQLRLRWGGDLKVALVSQDDGRLALEGYVERFETGGVNGRLLLSFDTSAQAAAAAQWRDAVPGVPQPSGARQHALGEPAIQELGAAALLGVSYIPQARLDAATVQARFGPPAARLAEGERLQHWLYPTLGLAVLMDSQGRNVLQYVAPADFEARLAAPLKALRPPA